MSEINDTEIGVQYKSLAFMGYERYWVGNDGSVWRHYLGKDKWRKRKPQKVTESGYLGVMLSERNKQKMFLVHRLVLMAFAGPCPKGMEARHFPDGDKTNNRRENLSWGTPKQNYQDQIAHGTCVNVREDRQITWGKLNPEKALEIRNLYKTGKFTQKKLGEMFGVKELTIHSLIKRKSWKQV